MQIVWNKEEYNEQVDGYHRHDGDDDMFPVIVYHEHEEFGLMGDGVLTYVHVIPEEYRSLGYAAIYFEGFKDGKDQ